MLCVERWDVNQIGVEGLRPVTGLHHDAVSQLLKAHASDYGNIPLKHNPSRVIFIVKIGRDIEGVVVLSRESASEHSSNSLQVLTFTAADKSI